MDRYMGPERREGSERRRFDCNPATCQYHALTDMVVSDLKLAVDKLLDGQTQMRETVIKLGENMKAFNKLDARLDKMEELYTRKETEQDEKIDKLRTFMYKAIGGGSVFMVVLSIVLKITLGV